MKYKFILFSPWLLKSPVIQEYLRFLGGLVFGVWVVTLRLRGP